MTLDISIVMSVHNGANRLSETMDSVLSQEGVELEFIVVNDGSTDATAAILEEYAAKDERVRLISLEKRGLTRALIAGCRSARAELIARQDCADRSAPCRLVRQAALLASHPEAVMAAVGTQFLGPDNEALYKIGHDPEALRHGLAGRSLRTIRGPSHHGAMMFRRRAYEAVGGYRDAFHVAQDIDLWLRLLEIGDCVSTPDILYEASLSAGSISHLRRDDQLRATQVIIDCAARRRNGGCDAELVERWRQRQERRDRAGEDARRTDAARFHYFLAGVLRKSDPGKAKAYYRRSLKARFWRPKTWVRLAMLIVASSISFARKRHV